MKKEKEALNLAIHEMLTKQAVDVVDPKHVNKNDQYLSSLFVRPKKDGGLRPIFNLKKPKQVRGIQSLQNGRVSSCKNHPKTKRLHVQGRSERRIFLCTNKPRSEEIPQICMAGGDATVQKSTIWLGMRSIGLYQNYGTPNRSIAADRGTSSHLPRRHSDNEPIKRGINSRQGFPDSPTSPSRVGDELEKNQSHNQTKY